MVDTFRCQPVEDSLTVIELVGRQVHMEQVIAECRKEQRHTDKRRSCGHHERLQKTIYAHFVLKFLAFNIPPFIVVLTVIIAVLVCAVSVVIYNPFSSTALMAVENDASDGAIASSIFFPAKI